MDNMDNSPAIIEGILRLAEQDGADWREVFARIMAAFTDFAYRQEVVHRDYIIESAVAGILGWRRVVTGDGSTPDLAIGNELIRVASMLTGDENVRIAHLVSVLAVFIAGTDDPTGHVAKTVAGIPMVVGAIRAARAGMAS